MKTYQNILKKWSKKENLNQFGLVVTEQAFRSASNMIISILLGRIATKDEYGIYTLLFSVMLILLEIQSGLIRMPYVSLRIGKTENEKLTFLGNTLVFHLSVSLVFIVLSVILAAFAYFRPIIGLNSKIILLFSGATVAVMLREFLRQVLLTTFDAKSLVKFGITVNGSLIIITILLYVFKLLTIETTYILITATSVIPNICLIFLLRHQISFDITRMGKDIYDCCNIGKWLVGRALLTMLSGPLILNSRLAVVGTYSDVAMYGVCMIPAVMLSPLLQALDSFMIPKIAQAYSFGKAEVVKLTSKFNLALLLLLFFFNSGIFIFSNQIMRLIFNGKYPTPPLLLLLFTLQMSILIYAVPVSSALVAIKNTRSGFIGEIIAALITVIVGLPLVSYFGIWGIAWSQLLSRTANRGFQIYVYNRLMKHED